MNRTEAGIIHLFSFIFLITYFIHCLSTAQNPIKPGIGLCDPHIRIYNDRAYLYATHDSILQKKDFMMNDWWVWSSDDLVSWKYESTLKPENTYFGKKSTNCWATDAVSKNGKYYFYFSMGFTDIGVVESLSPTSPWHDPIKKALVPASLTPVEERDPGIIADDDGNVYIVFGVWDFYIAWLNNDMVSLAEAPKKIMLDKKEGPYGLGKTDDKPYLHKYRDNYYLSWGCYYAMSKNVYGPYAYKGSVIIKERTDKEFQKGLTQDRHGSFFQFYNQWYYICNDQSYQGSNEFFRNSVLSYVHYKDNGEIEPVYLTKTGVGRYDASVSAIEAENYFKLFNAAKSECPAGFEIRELKEGSYLYYPNIFNLKANAELILTASSANARGGKIEIREKNAAGKLLGEINITDTGGWDKYRTFKCRLKNDKDKLDLYLLFKGNPKEFVRIDKLAFE